MFDILRMCMVVLEPFFFLYHSSKDGVSFIGISICAEFFSFFLFLFFRTLFRSGTLGIVIEISEKMCNIFYVRFYRFLNHSLLSCQI